MDIQNLAIFFGWTSVVSMVILTVSSLMLLALKDIIAPRHAKMFGLKQADVLKIYFDYLGRFKALVIVFNIAPYIALRIMLS